MKRAEEAVNLHDQPIPLESGVILAAADTPGSRQPSVLISEGDERRYVHTNKIALVGKIEEVPVPMALGQETSAATPAAAPTERTEATTAKNPARRNQE